MFTQCTKCETVFRLSAETLRAAGGQVRCGRCGEVFNALARLAEDPTSFIVGDSPLDMENRADVILEFPPSLDLSSDAPSRAYDTDGDGGVEIAHLHIVDPSGENGAHSDPSSEMSLEFTLPPDDLDRVFLPESRPGALRRLIPDAQSPDDPYHPESRHYDDDDEEFESEETPTELLMTPAEMRYPVPHVAKKRPAKDSSRRATGADLPDDVRQAVRAVYDNPELPDLGLAPRREIPFNAWLGAAVALGLLLVIQLMQGSRDWLASHTQAGSGVRGLFSMVGVTVPAAANLSGYQLRQWGVSGDPAAAGTLRVRASVLNTSAQLQPYPLLRVTLANRYGAHIAAREFDASEYMGKPVARLLNPGERLDATIDILDPGKDAEGFEIDVCLRDAAKRLYCSGDTASKK